MGSRIEHRYRPVGRSPGGLALRHIVDGTSCDSSMYVGEQWLGPDEEVGVHIHEVEEILIFTAGDGIVVLGNEEISIAAGVTVHIPAGERHGFRNTGDGELRLFVLFPIPVFADTHFEKIES